MTLSVVPSVLGIGMTATLGVLAADRSQILAHPTRTNRSAAPIVHGYEDPERHTISPFAALWP